MTTHINDLIPFYINNTLSPGEVAAVETHLEACPDCRTSLVEWQQLSASLNQVAGIRLSPANAQKRAPIPPLSPVVTSSLRPRPSFQQALNSAVHLIWAQRIFITMDWVLPFLFSFILLGFLLSSIYRGLFTEWAIFPLLAVIPISAALISAALFTFDSDPASEIILTLPTSTATLIFARQTLALGIICLLAFSGSLLLISLGRPFPSLFGLVAAWLGPMLLLSALTTMLTLYLPPQAAAGASLALWGSLLLLLFSEHAGAPVLNISLLWLLNPGWRILLLQVSLAVLLWLFSLLQLDRYEPGQPQSMGSS